MIYDEILSLYTLKPKVNELELIDLIYNRNTIAIPTTKSRILRDRRKQITEIYKAYFGANNDQRISEFNSYMKNIGLIMLSLLIPSK